MKRRNIGALITGLLLLIIGVGFIGEATHLWNFNLFFPGWWTLFIIIPAFSAIVGQGFHTGNVAWLIFGVLMLLACQDWFKSFMSWQLFLGIFIVYWGACNCRQVRYGTETKANQAGISAYVRSIQQYRCSLGSTAGRLLRRRGS